MSDCCGNSGDYIYACSGGSDVGFLSDRVARMLSVAGHGKMYCLAGIGADIESFMQSAKRAGKNIVIDGCAVKCGKTIMDKHGIPCDSYVITEFGYEKNRSGVSDDIVKEAFMRVNPVVEGSITKCGKSGPSGSGSCCCGG